MLTINRIREHFQAAEVERLRQQVQEMQAEIAELSCELRQTQLACGSSREEFDRALCGQEDWSI